MPELPRLKPDPIPEIHPVAEHAADGTLADVYARTKAGLRVPWMGVVAMAFARYPAFYARLWDAMEPVAKRAPFADACADLRAFAELEADGLSPPSILARLRAAGYGEAEIDDIRACNEVFSAGNMPYLLMASLARRLLEGLDWPADANTGASAPAVAEVARPPLIEPHHADPSMVALYADIRETLGLPFVNTDYRAFARWPTYFAPAWNDLRTIAKAQAHEAAAARIHARALSLAAGLANPGGLTSHELRSAAEADADLGAVLQVVRLFQWLLPGLALNVAFLRAQLSAS